ncbi:MAG TPA: TnsA endonuclease N-terminal domain-containing protein [Pseudomonadales bacterium]|nr:TnsA endonuclease N-terminal domain-containing protein [Pseudomonadales bacterium]
MTGPARKLKKSAVKNIVRFPAIKANGGEAVLLESILESKYCLHLEFDPTVKTYFPQPQTFKVPDGDGETTYTPDFEVHYTSGARNYVEVKPSKRAASAEYQQLFARFESTLINPNYRFVVVDERAIYQRPLLSNYEKLYQYRKRPLIEMDNLHHCAADICRPMALSQLVARLGNRASLREIYSWLALGYLQFDMHSETLTMSTEVEFYVD